ncbi:MAG: D-alanine--D-alanine ligase A [Acidobacteria bacterium]|nr:MAG: D-alanine--D-alanine ligase A [Acidobacteriota bacterium]
MTKVAVLFGGESPEYEVSIVSAENILKQLELAGFETAPIGIDPSGKWHFGSDALNQLKRFRGDGSVKIDSNQRLKLAELQFDVLFPIIHGRTGEDGSIQGFCELLGFPYVGGGVLNQAICMDKITTKRLLTQAGFPQPLWRDLLLKDVLEFKDREICHIESSFGYPVFVKPSRAGSSIGITKAKNRMELLYGLQKAFDVDSRVIVEQAVPNPVELEVSALGKDEPFLSVFGEVIPQGEYYDFNDKYLDGATRFIVPAHVSASMEKDMKTQARKAWKLLNCHGMARIDFLCSGQTAYLSEINTVPGFTDISMYPNLLEKSGISQVKLMRELVKLAFEKHETSQKNYRFNSQSSWYVRNTEGE